MKKKELFAILALLLLLAIVGDCNGAKSPTPTRSPTRSLTPIPSITPSNSFVPSTTPSAVFNPNLPSTNCYAPCNSYWGCNSCQDCNRCDLNCQFSVCYSSCNNEGGPAAIPTVTPNSLECGNHCDAACNDPSDCAGGYGNTCTECYFAPFGTGGQCKPPGYGSTSAASADAAPGAAEAKRVRFRRDGAEGEPRWGSFKGYTVVKAYNWIAKMIATGGAVMPENYTQEELDAFNAAILGPGEATKLDYSFYKKAMKANNLWHKNN